VWILNTQVVKVEEIFKMMVHMILAVEVQEEVVMVEQLLQQVQLSLEAGEVAVVEVL
tara:strand:- start:21 stop:191 length:171 start_codon:yes stop_codon:yes gene_type:complete